MLLIYLFDRERIFKSYINWNIPIKIYYLIKLQNLNLNLSKIKTTIKIKNSMQIL